MTDFEFVPDRDAGNPARRAAARAVAAKTASIPEPISPVVICGLMRVAELLIVALTGINAYYGYVADREIAMAGAYWTVSLATAFAAVAVFDLAGLYAISSLRSFMTSSARLVAAWSAIIATLLAIAFFTKIGAEFSRAWIALWFASGATILVVARVSASATIRMWGRRGRLTRRAVIIGGGPRAASLIGALSSSRDCGVEICGIFDDRDDERSPAMVAGCPKLGSVETLIEFARTARIDLLIVALPITAEQRVLEILKRLWVLPVDIRLSAHMSRLRFRPRAYSYIGPVPFLDIFDRPLCDWGLVLKQIEDIVVASLSLVLLAPVMAAIALAVKIDSPGPVLFRQRRYGFNNEMIEVLKFRSMYTEATDATASRLVCRDDPRVTRIGRFIRRTSLDELPQLINVLRGELSLVGPRPHAVLAKADDRLYADVVDGYFARHRVRPGITGWAQVNGWRGETENDLQIQRRVEHDLYYIENWSIAFDLYILAMTPLALFNTDQAY